MDYNFYIIDDDPSIIKIVRNIIMDGNLGDVCGTSTSGVVAIDEINSIKPDIVIVDLLLPEIDGIKLVSDIKKNNYEITFIMLSQVSSKEMVSKAYKAGVEYYINKPVNVIEMRQVIKRIDEKIKMKKVIESFESAFKNISEFKSNLDLPQNTNKDIKQSVNNIFSEIGIRGENGNNDILEIILFLHGYDDGLKKEILNYKLYDLYTYVSDKYDKETSDKVSTKTIEQRIRRVVSTAQKNIAFIGNEDFSNIVFEKYSSSLFDLGEIHKEINILKGISKGKGKVNIKKFIAGISMEIK